MIIDAHAHLYDSAISGLNVEPEVLLETMDRVGVESAVVQPFPYPKTPVEQVHDAIAELAVRHGGRIFGLASIDPYWPADRYRREAARCTRELGFVALKLHPLAHRAPINAPSSNIVFQTADDLGVPVMIHTGFGVPFTLPALAIPRARQYPRLRIVLAHAGESLYAAEALVAATECENIFLETSWSQPGGIQKFVSVLGAGRIMMGSDLPNNLEAELAKYRSIQISDEQRRQCLELTARQVFGLVIDT
jgi:predicted TIM-barrel fold metal-dependent hydrolase